MSDVSDLDTSSSWDPMDLNDSDDYSYSEPSDWEYLSDDSTINRDPEGMTPIVDYVSKFHYVVPGLDKRPSPEFPFTKELVSCANSTRLCLTS